jgi:hypothetical protein
MNFPNLFTNVIVSNKEGLLHEGIIVETTGEYFTIITSKNEHWTYEKDDVNVRQIRQIAV